MFRTHTPQKTTQAYDAEKSEKTPNASDSIEVSESLLPIPKRPYLKVRLKNSVRPASEIEFFRVYVSFDFAESVFFYT